MNEKQLKLSIIVPVYNVESTLRRCVDSLINQGLSTKEYEVILVNDGSTDHSSDIAIELKDKYENVILLTQENQGLGGARNTGIEAAQGEFITFVDSDDYIKENKLASLINICIEQNLDVLRFKKLFISFSGEELPNKLSGIIFNHVYSGKEAFCSFVGSACASIFRTSIFKDNGLFFTKGITQEDVEFTTRFFTKVKRVMAVDDVAYICMYNDQSLSRNKNFDKKNKYICDGALVASLGFQFAKNHVEDAEMKDLIIRRSNSAIMGSLINFIRVDEYPKSIVKNYIRYAKELHIIPIKGKSSSKKTDLLIPIVNHSSLYFFIYNIFKSFK